MFLMIDNYDSFVYNLVRYVKELNEEVITRRNDDITIAEIRKLNPRGIIISPGPKRPEDAGLSEDIVRELGGDYPILGICLGHQVIGHVFGGTIVEGLEPVHGKVHPIYHHEKDLYNGIPMPFNATRYHSLIVEETTLPSCLEVTSRTKEGTIMGLRHKEYPIEGVQFHPEAELTEYGHELLRNFVHRCQPRS